MAAENTRLGTAVSADGAAILDPCSGKITTLNETGAFVWQALQRGERAEEIARNLARDTGEDLAVVEQGVTAFITELTEHHLWSPS
jgi:hypothetical protein